MKLSFDILAHIRKLSGQNMGYNMNFAIRNGFSHLN